MKYLKAIDNDLEVRSRKFYNSASWKKARNFVKQHKPLCAKCEEEGRITAGVDCDHITPIKENYSKRLDFDNLQMLCRPCHIEKTRADNKEKFNRKNEQIKEGLDSLMDEILNNR